MVIMMGIWCNDKLVIGWSVSTEQKQANKNKFCNYVKLLLQMDELTGPNFSFFFVRKFCASNYPYFRHTNLSAWEISARRPLHIQFSNANSLDRDSHISFDNWFFAPISVSINFYDLGFYSMEVMLQYAMHRAPWSKMCLEIHEWMQPFSTCTNWNAQIRRHRKIRIQFQFNFITVLIEFNSIWLICAWKAFIPHHRSARAYSCY